MDLRTYRNLFAAGKPVQQGTVTGIVGRILRGKDPADFETITNDIQRDGNYNPIRDAAGNVIPNRMLGLCVDANACGDLIGLAGNTYAMLKSVGYSQTDVEHYAAEGLDWKLVVFEDNGSSLTTLATWDNIIDLAAKLYPQVSHLLVQFRDTLQTLSFADIVRMSGEPIWIPRISSEKAFMSPERLLRSRGTVVDVRRFFFDTLQLRELYRGDGWTYNAAGVRGVPEYFVPSVPLTKLGKYELIDLPPLRLPKHAAGRASTASELPVPGFFDGRNASLWGYTANAAKLLEAAPGWRKQHGIKGAAADRIKVGLLLIDLQGDFVFPEGTLYVGGRSGTGAIDDNVRIAEFIYRNLGRIHQITPTMDTHEPFQIFSRSFWLDQSDAHPAPFTSISPSDITDGKLRPNPMVAGMLNVSPTWLTNQVQHYADELQMGGKYQLMLWTEHCLLGGPGHALAGVIQEARLFHAYVRGANNSPEVKGGNPLTENYSILRPEVLTRWDGGRPDGRGGVIPTAIAQKNTRFIEQLFKFDAVIIAGQAASHCVKSSIDDLLTEIVAKDPALAKKIFVLEDCMSSVTVPNPAGGFFADYTPEAAAALRKFSDAGMHVVRSTDPMESWPGIQLP